MVLSRTLVRHAVGLASLGLVVLGVGALAGWAWAAIATGAPAAAFYVWGEVRAARAGSPERVE